MEDDVTFTLLTTQERAHVADVNCIKFHPTLPNILASCSDDGTVKIWRLVGN